MDQEINKLRRLNIGAGILHLVSLVAVLALATGFSLPVVATYLTEAPGSGNFSAPINLFSLRVSCVVAAFLGLSAFFRFLISSPKFFPRYEAGLK